MSVLSIANSHRRLSNNASGERSPLRPRLRCLCTTAFVLALTGLQMPQAQAQSDASARQSQASVMASIEVPAAVLSAIGEGGKFVVTAVAASAGAVAITVSAVGLGASYVVYLSAEVVERLAISAGTAVEAVAVSGGWLLMASGEALCFIANDAARAHVHTRALT